MQIHILKITILLNVLIITACSPMIGKIQCQQGDWRSIGYNDGKRGIPHEHVNQYFTACDGVANAVIDTAAYNEGWQEGSKFYCRPANGYIIGLRGQHYNGECVTNNEDAFLDSYVKGISVYTISVNLETIRHEVHDTNQKMFVYITKVDKELEILRHKIKRLRMSLESKKQDKEKKRLK